MRCSRMLGRLLVVKMMPHINCLLFCSAMLCQKVNVAKKLRLGVDIAWLTEERQQPRSHFF
ncbi:MAG: hypothetical protein KME38_23445 [Spirirestis rafaelensis WJT71-NPBG6]|nr:hypothetical protein [Spirirestis rafaelensis WJT71-NPBG6]